MDNAQGRHCCKPTPKAWLEGIEAAEHHRRALCLLHRQATLPAQKNFGWFHPWSRWGYSDTQSSSLLKWKKPDEDKAALLVLPLGYFAGQRWHVQGPVPHIGLAAHQHLKGCCTSLNHEQAAVEQQKTHNPAQILPISRAYKSTTVLTQ